MKTALKNHLVKQRGASDGLRARFGGIAVKNVCAADGSHRFTALRVMESDYKRVKYSLKVMMSCMFPSCLTSGFSALLLKQVPLRRPRGKCIALPQTSQCG
nr:hypothetical protein [Acetobacter persici]